MRLFHEEKCLEEVIRLECRYDLIGVCIGTPFKHYYGEEVPGIEGPLPPLVTNIISKYAKLVHDSFYNTHYIISVVVIRMKPCRTIEVPRRVRTLVLAFAQIESMSRSHSSVCNTKSKNNVSTCPTLWVLDIANNPTFRVTLTSSLKRIQTYGCRSLREIKHKESLLLVARYEYKYRKMRANQRSIKHFQLYDASSGELFSVTGGY